MPRPIVISPYFREDPSLLRRCIASVRGQSVATQHMLVSDGHPQAWIDQEHVRHLRLDRSHGDFGNIARGVAATLAAAEGFWPIMMLDADNWLEPQHVELCLNASKSSPHIDFVVAKRSFRRVDQSLMPIEDEPIELHVDTNCFVYFPGSFHLLPIWALLPTEMSIVGDRVLWAAVRARNLSGIVITGPATVNYHCMRENLYRQLGEAPPVGAKPAVDCKPPYDWWSKLNEREQEIVARVTGLRPSASGLASAS